MLDEEPAGGGFGEGGVLGMGNFEDFVVGKEEDDFFAVCVVGGEVFEGFF